MKARLLRVFGVLFLSAALALAPAVTATAAAGELVEVPDLVGEPLNLALKPLDALGLDVKIKSGGRAVIVKKNWVVTKQWPAAGTMVEPGTRVTLTVIKKSELLSEGNAVGICRQWANTDPSLPYGVRFEPRKFVTDPQGLGWAIDLDGWAKTSTGGEVAVRVYCEISGTKKKPSVDVFEVTER